MLRFSGLPLVVCLLTMACGRQSPAPQPEVTAATNESPAAVVAEPDVTSVLAELTQALRRFSAEKQQVPVSLDALVSAGYIRNLPQPPAGKAFVVDQKNVRVVLK